MNFIAEQARSVVQLVDNGILKTMQINLSIRKQTS